MISPKTSVSSRMLLQRCRLDEHRLILSVNVTKPALSDSGFSNALSQNQFRALVDTGAQRTVVSRSLIDQLGLMRVGHMQFSGLHGERTHSRYLAGFGFWARRLGNDKSQFAYEQAEQTLFNVDGVFEVVNMDDNTKFDLILGFDVLKRFSFNFDRGSQQFEIIVV